MTEIQKPFEPFYVPFSLQAKDSEQFCHLVGERRTAFKFQGPIHVDVQYNKALLVTSYLHSNAAVIILVSIFMVDIIYLQVSRSTIQIKIQVFDFSKLRKLVMDVFLCGFFMDTGHKQDPALHSCKQMKKRLQKSENKCGYKWQSLVQADSVLVTM